MEYDPDRNKEILDGCESELGRIYLRAIYNDDLDEIEENEIEAGGIAPGNPPAGLENMGK